MPTIELPKLHKAQAEALYSFRRFNVICCGRRWGKTVLLQHRTIIGALRGQRRGWFAPTYNYLKEPWDEMKRALAPIITKSNDTERRIELSTGGMIDGWTLENKDAGRSRRYHGVVIDEAAMVANLGDIYNNAIRPTLSDYDGAEAIFASTPAGMNFFAEVFDRGADPLQTEWASWRFPTSSNPHISAGEIEAARLGVPDKVYRQEYLAEFLEDAGGVFTGVREACRLPALATASGRTYIGIDLAKTTDYTVITGLDEGGRMVHFERFNGLPWGRQVERLAQVIQRFPGCVVHVDATGVGDPVLEQIKTLTRGLSCKVEGYRFTAQSKEPLIENLALLIEQGRLALLDDPVILSELRAYQYTISKSGNVTMNAPAGMHDDAVIALALAAWPMAPKPAKRIGLLS